MYKVESTHVQANLSVCLSPSSLTHSHIHSAENIVDRDGRALAEAAFCKQTEHVLLPPFEAQLPVRGEVGTQAATQAKGRWRLVASAIKAASLLGSSTDDALMTSELLHDYLEQAARDQIDREHIKRNEFGWLLKHKIAQLDEDGTLPPRFSGLAGGGMKRQISRVSTPKKRKEAGAAPDAAEGASTASAAEPIGKEYYSELAEAPVSVAEAAELSERGKRDLLRRWLRRKLYEEIQEQAFAFSRGLREMIPLGVLELYSVDELLALLGAGPAVNNASLADWRRHTEYGNGLDESSERVAWFWEVPPSNLSAVARVPEITRRRTDLRVATRVYVWPQQADVCVSFLFLVLFWPPVSRAYLEARC